MTFELKCGCGAILLAIVKEAGEVSAMVDAHGWELEFKDPPYFAWVDTIPAVCPVCRQVKIKEDVSG